MGGGAWPFLVGGVTCLVNSVNERDLRLLSMSRASLSGFGTVRSCKGIGVVGQLAAMSAAPMSVIPNSCEACMSPAGVFREARRYFLEGLRRRLQREEAGGNNRSVMPLDVLGRTRATMTRSTSLIKGDFLGRGLARDPSPPFP